MESKHIKINGVDIFLSRLKLKDWTKLDRIRRVMEDAISKSDYTEYFRVAIQFIEVASSSSLSFDWEQIPWYEFLELYSQLVLINAPQIDFPVLHGDSSIDGKLPWEYEGRTWFFWFNLFAESYGWTENQIENLDIDTALGLYQEILISKQFTREWEWGLSEVSTVYNKSTKSSEFRPLERPDWMKPLIPKSLPIVRMKKEHLPMGNIIDLSAPKDGKRGI